MATPFLIARHTHRAGPQAKREEPTPTGIDYLGLVQTAHDEESGTGEKVLFSQPGLFSDQSEKEAR